MSAGEQPLPQELSTEGGARCRAPRTASVAVVKSDVGTPSPDVGRACANARWKTRYLTKLQVEAASADLPERRLPSDNFGDQQ
jgi:hypothetical protein